MSSELDPGTTGTQDPTGGEQPGSQSASQQGTPAPQAPAGRSFSDADMAAARRSWEADSQRREARLRQEFTQQFIPREQPKPNDPYAAFDPQVAAALQAAIDARLQPFQQFQKQAQDRQDDLDFRNEEVDVRTKYPDYAKNRAEILEFAVKNGIATPDAAYHAWRSMNQWPDEKAIRNDERTKYYAKKTAQAAGTPSVEGRGGGAPSSKQPFKSREDMDEAAMAMIQAAQDQ
jgi:hypothetical protein